MKKDKIIAVLKYFHLFDYPPSIDEMYSFINKRASKAQIEEELSLLLKNRQILIKNKRYALGGHSNIFNIWSDRKTISLERFKKATWIIKFFSNFSQIKLIGISGALAMNNCKPNDDIDIFAITKRNRMWTARFILLLLSSIFGMRRKFKSKDINNKLCFNLFISETDLEIIKDKQNIYVAHEAIQMKPVIDRDDTYRKFLNKNTWISDKYFPNIELEKYIDRQFLLVKKNSKTHKNSLIGDLVEYLFKKIQLLSINNHKTNEILRYSQLWFFPDDFEKKIPKNILE